MPKMRLKTYRGLKVHYIDPRRILPVNEIVRWAHFHELVIRMRKYGWQGRPELVEVMHGGKHYQALTGSHRTAAAKAAKLRVVPVVFARGGRAAKGLTLCARTTDDPSRYNALRRRRDPAARLMREELVANARSNARGTL